ncbi:methyltransferase [Candidatus Micrarchaeota archaeon]|nr:methyltransferase [Candidatus Micrarchaeota archaeon]
MELAYKGRFLVVPATVYPPAEDSFMLAEAAESLQGNILEIGCGCGIVSLSCQNADSILGVDINSDAVECAKKNAEHNHITNAKFIQSNLFSGVKGTFDAILFNPPYLPTEKNERLSDSLNYAFDGGLDGRKTLDVFLTKFDNYLKPHGQLLLVQSSLNNLEKTVSTLKQQNYTVTIKEQQNFFFEKLYLLKASKT